MTSGVQGWGGARKPMDVDLQRVMETLDWLADKMQSAADTLAEADLAWTEAKVTYELAYAEALLKSKESNQKAREADALLKCRPLFRDVESKAVVMRVCKEATYTLKNRMAAYQSVSAILRGATN